MPYRKKVADLMNPLEDYPHVPYWFTLRQATAIVRKAAIKFEGTFEPRAVLVFDEKYQILGILTLRDIIRGLAPKFLQGAVGKLPAAFGLDSALSGLEADLSGPRVKEASARKAYGGVSGAWELEHISPDTQSKKRLTKS